MIYTKDKSCTLHLRLPRLHCNYISKMANKYNRSMSEYVRMLIAYDMSYHGKETDENAHTKTDCHNKLQ